MGLSYRASSGAPPDNVTLDLNASGELEVKIPGIIKMYEDNAGGSTTSDSETDLASVTVTQNDLGDDATLYINASLWAAIQDVNADRSATFKLYVDGVAVETQIIQHLRVSGGPDTQGVGGSITHVAKNIDTTAGNIIIKITGENDFTSGGSMTCYGLSVLGVR